MSISEEKKQLHDDDASTLDLNGRPFDLKDVLFCTTRGNIYAISKSDGTRYWRQDFPESICGAYVGVVSVFVTDDGKLMAGANGKIACIDVRTGNIKWVNRMKGMGLDEVGVLCTISQFGALDATHDALNGTGAELPPSYDRSTTNEKQVMFGCTRGKVMAIDPETGEEIWRYDCPNGGYNIPSLLVERQFQGATLWPFTVVFIGCGRWVYCLRASSGEVLWKNQVSNSTFGLSYMCLATFGWSSRMRAEIYTDFSSTPLAQARDFRRRQQSNTIGK
ncbi:quinon protein alcohol dehydrogenase-like superfamily [Gongronella butleri]|nr:quinon protein alcohol dehydrogenase-like superfamily [Gongronella butleri]